MDHKKVWTGPRTVGTELWVELSVNNKSKEMRELMVCVAGITALTEPRVTVKPTGGTFGSIVRAVMVLFDQMMLSVDSARFFY